ncbi:hypothetical protein B0T10DRAFT_116326 [Thelonectria olida]|uniref:Uncharacterized protein n=1 Tax=Thelonectria olida TaxID=1576542 RepID=A0A9P8WJU8_9HYPO|nr:hypothetical protein B0T10DRAFT_116326 [Thelonectria olida]
MQSSLAGNTGGSRPIDLVRVCCVDVHPVANHSIPDFLFFLRPLFIILNSFILSYCSDVPFFLNVSISSLFLLPLSFPSLIDSINRPSFFSFFARLSLHCL